MQSDIKCPNCGHEFDIENVLSAELEQKYQKEFQEKLNSSLQNIEEEKKRLAEEQKQFEEKRKRENEIFAQKLAQEKLRITTEVQETVKKDIANEYENRLKLLQEADKEKEEKLKEARKKELEFLQKEQALKTKEEELELSLQRQLIEEREKLKEQLSKEEAEKISIKEQEYQLRMKEMEKQIEDQKKLVEEMRRKSEQGSMQLQGEVQELMLESLLQTTFPFDKIEEVGKGVRGADCIQTVRNQFGNEAGKIIYESKRTKDFANDWIEKLKTDMRNLGADVAIIVTQTLPKDMDRFGEKDGVYICTFNEVRSVALLLRNALLKIADAKKSQENKGDKMVMLYDYLIGSEFSEQWKAIREGFMTMKLSIQKERDAMEKLWKAREKQLEKVLLNAAHIKGSIEGIAGADAVNLNLLEDNDPLILE
ncbi:MAG: DUF2130 domain-containing protein [Sediminibacterium sp. Gen4]|jgi:hypothetical protein|uniref:DUF2130 domain-containing protein n=1 Tax=unclassified Sediminibacterium TaxID=2635961 RepID=UPI0015BFE1E4|nr:MULTISPECIES: DUF2130 domain-containing protein [unclassified Sediminibacterium]MBW0164556.1 DUF2130 domain-containing protein [Sediminibacterium sp.]NWK64998.1 DUF2130 domain-containing protein [Sediminibacterium sp. Gen4]